MQTKGKGCSYRRAAPSRRQQGCVITVTYTLTETAPPHVQLCHADRLPVARPSGCMKVVKALVTAVACAKSF